jgi:hypothetical protein
MLMNAVYFVSLYMYFAHKINKYLNYHVSTPINFDEVLKPVTKALDRI